MTQQKKRSRVAHADHRISSKVNGERDSRVVKMLGAASEIGDQPQMRLLCAGTIALALARRDGLPAWTSDQNWKRIADAVEVKVVTIG